MEASAQIIQQFHQRLKNFSISEDGATLLRETTFVPMAAISSSGRNTIIRELVKTGGYYFMVSDTSRPPRDNDGVMEQDGVEYWFRTAQEIYDDLVAGQYLEAAVIHTDHVYATSLRELKRAADMGAFGITDMEVQGVANVMAVPDNKTVPIFLLPPSYEEWRRRIGSRGEMAKDVLRKREVSAVMELGMALENDYYHFVINDDLKQAVADVDAVANGKLTGHQEAGRKLAQELRARIQQDIDKVN